MSNNVENIYERVSYDEVYYYLRSWINSGGCLGHYDFGGMVHLLIACLKNLNQHALEQELEDMIGYFDGEELVAARRVFLPLQKDRPIDEEGKN